MTIARITAHDGVGTSSAAFGGTPTSGNLLLAVVADTAAGTTITGWTSIVTNFDAGIGALTLFAKTAAGTEGTITPSGSFVFQTSVCEYSGTKNPFAQDATAISTKSTSTVTSLASGAITTADAGSLIFAAGIVAGAVTGNAWSGGLSAVFLANTGTGEKGVAGEYLPGTTVTSFTTTHSWTQATGGSQVLLAAFKPTATASGPVNVKTVGGLAKASVKTVAGLPIASVKSIEGIA